MDAIEFIHAEATFVLIKIANFIDTEVCVKIIAGMEDYLIRHKIKDVNELIGLI